MKKPEPTFCQSMIQRIKRACLFPKMIAETFEKREQQTILNELEAERLDRICNPSKYLGK